MPVPWKKVMRNLDILYIKLYIRNIYITLLTKFRIVKALVFPVVMYGCEIWTIKKAEHRKIEDFEVWN